MGPNKLTPGENVRWQSKMMLTEHVEALIEQQRDSLRRQRIYLAEEEQERIFAALSSSHRHRVPVSVRMYDPFEELRVEGVVEAVTVSGRSFRVEGDWYRIEDVEGVEFYDDW